MSEQEIIQYLRYKANSDKFFEHLFSNQTELNSIASWFWRSNIRTPKQIDKYFSVN